jgi:hypothetical protein
MKRAIATIIAAVAVLTAAYAEIPDYRSKESLYQQQEYYLQVYKEEGDAYVSGDMKTYEVCRKTLATVDRLATIEFGKTWITHRNRAKALVDASRGEE